MERLRPPLLPRNVNLTGNQGTSIKIVDHSASFFIIFQTIFPDMMLLGGGSTFWNLVS